MSKPRFLTAREINTIRGKMCVNAASTKELQSVFAHLDLLELALDLLDEQDTFGTEGWRHAILGEDN